MVGLLEPLRNDLGRSIRIQETMPNDLAHYLLGASIVGLGPACFALQSQGPLSFKDFQQLKIALPSVTEFPSSLRGTQSLAFAFEKHCHLTGDFIMVGQEDRTGMSDELCARIEELEHGVEDGEKSAMSQIKYGGIYGGKRPAISKKLPKMQDQRVQQPPYLIRHFLAVAMLPERVHGIPQANKHPPKKCLPKGLESLAQGLPWG